MPSRHVTSRDALVATASASGVVAGVVSALVLAWRGRVENGAAASAVNGPSHWFWGDVALRQDRPTARYTLTGLAVHQASSFFWSAIYAAWLLRRRRASPAADAVDAAAITAAAAVIDLAVVPHRLTPGFEQRLSSRGLFWVYASFGAGLWIGRLLVDRRR